MTFNVLGDLGLGLASNAVYDIMKVAVNRTVSLDVFRRHVQDTLVANGIKADADNVITVLASKGAIVMNGSHLSAAQGLTWGANGGRAEFGNNGSLSGGGARVVATGNAKMVATGNAQVVIGNGNLSFRT